MPTANSSRPAETFDVLFERYGPRYRFWATLAIMLGTIATILTTTTVNVALPDIMGAFGIGQERAQWLSTGALAAMTVGMLINAWMVQRFGCRRTVIGALSIFIAASIMSGLAPNDTALILTRVLQGLVAGMLQPMSMYVLFRVFPAHLRGTAMGIFGVGIVLGPALGPTIGGILINHFNWRYVFYVSVPFAALGILLSTIFMPERDADSKMSAFDWPGFALLSVALASLLTGLSNGQREGWHSDFVTGLLALAAVSCTAFVLWERWVPQPLVDLRVLANGAFASSAAVACCFGAGLFGSVYLVPLFVQSIQGLTPLASGILLVPGGVVLGLFMPFGGWLSDRFPARTLIVFGLLCFAVSSWWMGGMDVHTPVWYIAWWVVVSRIGLALIKPALNVAALRALPPEQLGQGAGMINFARQLGAAFGVNLLSITLDRRTFFHGDALTETQTSANSATAELVRQVQALLAQTGAPPDVQASGAMHYLGRVLHAQAYTLGFRDAFLIVAVLFVLAIVPALVMSGRAPVRLGQR